MGSNTDFERDIYRSSAAPAGGLFVTHAEKVIRRVDAVLSLHNTLERQTRRFLLLMRSHQGKLKAMPLGRICETLNITPRQGKDIVQTLRLDHGIQIGASRDGSDGGYYLVAIPQESVEATAAMYAQAVTMLRVVRRMREGVESPEGLLHKLQRDLICDEEAVHG